MTSAIGGQKKEVNKDPSWNVETQQGPEKWLKFGPYEKPRWLYSRQRKLMGANDHKWKLMEWQRKLEHLHLAVLDGSLQISLFKNECFISSQNTPCPNR